MNRNPNSKQQYDRQFTQYIVQLVLAGYIYPTQKDIQNYIKTHYNLDVKESTIGNWFQNKQVKLADLRRMLPSEQNYNPNYNAITSNGFNVFNAYNNSSQYNQIPFTTSAPGVLRTSNKEIGEHICLTVRDRVSSNIRVDFSLIIQFLYIYYNVQYTPNEIEKICRKYTLTYYLPDVEYGRMTYDAYLNFLRANFPELIP